MAVMLKSRESYSFLHLISRTRVMELRHDSFLYAFIMTDDCIMHTAFESHISFIEFSDDRGRTGMILPVGWKKQSVHLICS